MSNDVFPRRADAPHHVGFPLHLDLRGRTSLADDDAYLAGLIEQVLFTSPGERVNRPDFGSGVARLVFAPSGDSLAESTQALVHGALQQWLGELIRVESVRVTAVDSRLEVVVDYLPLRATSRDQRRRVSVSGTGGPGGVGGAP